MFWYVGVALLLCVWSVSVLWCDVQSATFILNRNALIELVFVTNFFSAVVSGTVCWIVGRGSVRKLILIGQTLFDQPAMRNLLIAVSFLNLVSSFMLYYSFSLAGMTHVYALKTTEPLVMCLLSTEFLQRIRRRVFRVSSKSPYDEVEDYHAQMRPVSLVTWLSVLLVCVGVSLVCASLTRNEGQFLESNTIFFSYFLIFASNCTLALRTMLQKPLLHIIPDVSGVLVSSGIYMFTSLFAACALLVPMIFCMGTVVSFDKHVWEHLLMIGTCYCTYQICNGTILFFISPVSYAVLKQARVVLIFLFSAYYFQKSFSSIPQLVVGIIILFVGSVQYAKSQ